MARCCNAAPSVADAVPIYCADMTLNDVIGTQERQLSVSKCIKQKYLLVYYSEVSIILANINE